MDTNKETRETPSEHDHHVTLEVVPSSLGKSEPVPPFLLELGEHLFIAVVFAFILGLFLRKELREGLNRATEKFGEIIQNGLDTATGKFQATLREDLNNAIEKFQGIFQTASNEIVNSAQKELSGVGDKLTNVISEVRVQVLSGKVLHTKLEVTKLAKKDIDLKRFADAEARLLQADLDDIEVLITLVFLYLNPEFRRLPEALKLLRSKESLFKENPKFYFALATVYTDLKDHDNAIAAAQRYVELSPQRFPEGVKALISLGYTYYWFDDFAKAKDYTEKALSLLGEERKEDKLTYVCKSNLAYYYAKLKIERELAIKYASEAVAFENENANYLDNYGLVLMTFAKTKIDLEKAQENFIRAVQIDPALGAAYTHLAEANQKLKDWKPSETEPQGNL